MALLHSPPVQAACAVLMRLLTTSGAQDSLSPAGQPTENLAVSRQAGALKRSLVSASSTSIEKCTADWRDWRAGSWSVAIETWWSGLHRAPLEESSASRLRDLATRAAATMSPASPAGSTSNVLVLHATRVLAPSACQRIPGTAPTTSLREATPARCRCSSAGFSSGATSMFASPSLTDLVSRTFGNRCHARRSR